MCVHILIYILICITLSPEAALSLWALTRGAYKRKSITLSEYLYIYIDQYTYIYIYQYIYILIYIYVYLYIYQYIYILIYSYIAIYVSIYICNINIYIYINTVDLNPLPSPTSTHFLTSDMSLLLERVFRDFHCLPLFFAIL